MGACGGLDLGSLGLEFRRKKEKIGVLRSVIQSTTLMYIVDASISRIIFLCFC